LINLLPVHLTFDSTRGNIYEYWAKNCLFCQAPDYKGVPREGPRGPKGYKGAAGYPGLYSLI